MQQLISKTKKTTQNPNNINERILDPEKINPIVLQEHLSRYAFASQYVQGKKILDCGCAGGYGTNILSKQAREIQAIDISKKAINFAKNKFKNPNILFSQMDATNLKFNDSEFDTVISFEVIEHIKNQDKYLSEIKRVLKPGGLYVASTPNTEVFASDKNPFHEKEFTLQEFVEILQKHFENVELLGQKHMENIFDKILRKLRIRIMPSTISKSHLKKKALYFIAVYKKSEN